MTGNMETLGDGMGKGDLGETEVTRRFQYRSIALDDLVGEPLRVGILVNPTYPIMQQYYKSFQKLLGLWSDLSKEAKLSPEEERSLDATLGVVFEKGSGFSSVAEFTNRLEKIPLAVVNSVVILPLRLWNHEIDATLKKLDSLFNPGT